jgi:acetyl-CoA acetyltransferase
MGSNNMPLEDYASVNSKLLGRALFGMAGIAPKDLHVAQIYDAFTGIVLMALEDFGICKPGEAGEFAASGALRWPSGALPSNISTALTSSPKACARCAANRPARSRAPRPAS